MGDHGVSGRCEEWSKLEKNLIVVEQVDKNSEFPVLGSWNHLFPISIAYSPTTDQVSAELNASFFEAFFAWFLLQLVWGEILSNRLRKFCFS